MILGKISPTLNNFHFWISTFSQVFELFADRKAVSEELTAKQSAKR